MTHHRMKGAVSSAAFGLALGAATIATPARAHISLEQGGTHNSRFGDAYLKDGPCGKAGTRGTKIYTYEPGQKITVALVETIPHPSYYRFAFDNDGDDGFIEPASILPIDPARKCPTGPGDHCGASDFYNSPAVLPGMDNLSPHISAAPGTKYMWEVTLPNVECTNCTLQVIQVMQDDGPHGPYDPTPGVGVEDIYHQCIDIVLKRTTSDAGTIGDATAPPTGRDAGTGGSGGSGGGSSTGGAGGAAGGSGSTVVDSGSSPRDAATPPGTGGASGSGGTGTTTGTGGGAGTGTTTGTGGTAGTGTTTGTSGAAGTTEKGVDPPANGCSCTVVGGASRATAGWSLLALGLLSRRRRRR